MTAELTSVFPTRRIRGISSPRMRRIFRERRSWRCVGRRREEPAARRRATNGHVRRASFLGDHSSPPLRKSTKPFAALHRGPWSEALDLGDGVATSRGGLGRRSGRHRLRHSSKRCANPRVKDVLLESTIFSSQFPMRRPSFLAPSSAHGLVLPGRARLLPRVEVESPVLIDVSPFAN
jgi:hypothetical protein